MSITEKIKNYLEKLRAMPEQKKKIVLWTIVVVLALIMGIFWIRGLKANLSKMGEEMGKIEIPEFETTDMPKLDLEELENQAKQSDQNDESGGNYILQEGAIE